MTKWPAWIACAALLVAVFHISSVGQEVQKSAEDDATAPGKQISHAEELFKEGEQLYRQQDYQNAKKAFDKLSPKLRKTLDEFSLRSLKSYLKDLDKKIAHQQELLSRIGRADDLAAEGNDELARDMLEEVWRERAELPDDVHKSLAQKLGYDEEEELEIAEGEITPADAPADDAPVDTTDKARQLMEKLLKEQSIEEAHRRTLAENYYKTGLRRYKEKSYLEAKAELEKALRANPGHEAAERKLYEINALFGERPEKPFGQRIAEEQKVAKEQRKAEIESDIKHGQRLMDTGEHAKALGIFQKIHTAIQLSEHAQELAPYAQQVKGLIEQAKLQTKTAEGKAEQDRKALAQKKAEEERRMMEVIDQRRLNALLQRANNLFNQEKYDKALATAENILVLYPDNQDAMAIKEEARRLKHPAGVEEVRAEVALEFTRATENVAIAGIPYDEIIAYPPTWKEIEKRMEVTTEENGISDAEKEMRSKLERRITVSFDGDPISVVIDYLAEELDINIILLPTADQDLPDGKDTPVSLMVKDMKAGNVLKWLAEQVNLVHVVREDVVSFISFSDKITADVELRTYDVRDLTAARRTVNPPSIDISSLQGGDENIGVEFETEESETEPVISGEELEALIMESVAPESWDVASNSVKFRSGILIVVNSKDVQSRIGKLLSDMRTNELQVTVEIRFVSATDNFLEDIGVELRNFNTLSTSEVNEGRPRKDVEFSGSVDTGIAGLVRKAGNFTSSLVGTGFGMNLTGQILSSFDLDIILQAVHQSEQASSAQSQRLTMINNQRAYIALGTGFAYISDQNPSISTNAITYDPEVSEVFDGFVFEITPTVYADRKYVQLDVSPQLQELLAINEINIGTTTIGNGIITTFVQLPQTRTTLVHTTVLVPDRGTLLIDGLKEGFENRRATGVPFLSKIPILKALFTREGEIWERNSLIILITPRILITEEEEALL